MNTIAIITQSLNSGGAERMAANMSLMLENKYNVILIAFNKRNINYLYGGKLISYSSPYKRSNPFSHIISVCRRIAETKRIKRKYKIDVSISHQDRPNIINVLGGIGERKICCLHTSPTNVMGRYSVRAIIQKFVCKHSYKYIAVSKVAEDDLASIYKFPKNKLSCIYNFCDIDYIKSKSKENITGEHASFIFKHHFTIAFSGRLIKSKGYSHLFKAIKVLLDQKIDVCLLILGEGELHNDLAKISSQLEIDSHILFCGYVENPFSYLSKADIFVMPSEYEGLPMVLIEAAACGCPIISCDIVSGPREILAPGTDIRYKTKKIEFAEFGVLVPSCAGSDSTSLEISNEESIMAEAIRELLYNEGLRNKYIHQSAKLAQQFDKKVAIAEWIKLIEE